MSNGSESAYPTMRSEVGGFAPGLTKRERFAMAAMQGLCANGNVQEDMLYAPTAVTLADQLLAELERTEKRDE